MSRSVYLVTLGCAKNEVDSNRIRSLLENRGYAIVTSLEAADAAILNTCSFLEVATEEGIDCAFDIVNDEDFASRQGKLIITGCIPSRYGDDFAEAFTEAHAIVPAHEEDSIPDVLDALFGLDTSANAMPEETSALRIAESSSAYLKISEGCNRFCSFCAIPYIRGRYYSRPYDVLLAEATKLVSEGVSELVLVGQDTSVWGRDFEPELSIAWLVDNLAKAFPAVWIRILYIQPEDVTDELLEVMRSHENVCNYLDIPLQHVSAPILKRMNRKGDASSFLKLVYHIRDILPDVVLRTTLMTGFPGETEAEFEELLDFVDEGLFDYIGVFPYSAEEGTRAAKFDDQIEEDTKISRAQLVRDTADAHGFSRAESYIGKTLRVLIEGTEVEEDGETVFFGRFYGQAPDIDGIVRFSAEPKAPFVSVKIDDSLCYDLFGELVEE